MMQRQIEDVLTHLFKEEQNFGILCKVEHLQFTPELPQDIKESFPQMTLFVLTGYTYESAQIQADALLFEAGFGAENFGSVVTVPLLSIVQVIIDEQPIFLNLASPIQEIETKNVEKDEKGVNNSMNAFMSNPENQKFLK
jgi:hypothetical protein